MKILLLILIQITMITISGCQLIPENAQLRSYRVLVQQGNVIEESKVDSLKINMTKEQVIFLMGEPVINNIFDKERWDYVYYKKRDPEISQLNMVSIFFKNDSIKFKRSNNLPTIPTTIKDEIECNIFFRCENEVIKSSLNMKNKKPLEIFTKLRDLKDNF